MRSKVSTEWLRDLSQDDKERFIKSLLADKLILPKLLDILEEKEGSLDTQENKIEDFDDSAWAYKQAFRNGQRSVYLQIKKLISFS